MNLPHIPRRPVLEVAPTPPSLIDREQDLPGAWIIRHPDAGDNDITRAVILAQGWRTTPVSLTHLGNQIATANPETAAVIMEQKRINLPADPRQIRGFTQSIHYNEIGKLRTGTVLRVGSMICDTFGLDSIDLYGHSLGAIDATRAGIDSKRDFDIDTLALLAPAGLLESVGEVYGTIRRAPTASCGPGKNIPAENLPQIAVEAAYSLHENISLDLINLQDEGIDVVGLDFINDKLFPRHSMPQGFHPDKYRMVTEGCACHSAPSHPGEAALVAGAVQKLERPHQSSSPRNIT